MKLTSLRVGIFLAVRYLRRANIWTTGLTVFIMMLTFLNLVVLTGILVGLVEGAENGFRQRHAGDVYISTLPTKSFIERSGDIVGLVQSLEESGEVDAYSSRYVENATIEANYKRTINQRNVLPDTASAGVVGVDPIKENEVTQLSQFIVEGDYLNATDEDFVLLGANLLERYLAGGTGIATIRDVYPGDKILVSLSGIQKEMTVKGIVQSKADPTDLRVFMLDTQLRKIIGRYDYNIDEIAIKTNTEVDPLLVRDLIRRSGAEQYALVRVADESLGSFIEDIKSTFNILGNVLGSIGLVVASITVFIVIFITAITRQKFIGILKGIGITDQSIEISYVILSLFYSLIGISLGFLVTYFILVPYFAANPINFPFSDGILSVTLEGTIVRGLMIFIATIIAGYVPAKIVVRKNTLDAILGR